MVSTESGQPQFLALVAGLSVARGSADTVRRTSVLEILRYLRTLPNLIIAAQLS